MPDKILQVGAASMGIEKCPCCGKEPHAATIMYMYPSCHPDVGVYAAFSQELGCLYLLCKVCRRTVLVLPVEKDDKWSEVPRSCCNCHFPLPLVDETEKVTPLDCGHFFCDECASLPTSLPYHNVEKCLTRAKLADLATRAVDVLRRKRSPGRDS